MVKAKLGYWVGRAFVLSAAFGSCRSYDRDLPLDWGQGGTSIGGTLSGGAGDKGGGPGLGGSGVSAGAFNEGGSTGGADDGPFAGGAAGAGGSRPSTGGEAGSAGATGGEGGDDPDLSKGCSPNAGFVALDPMEGVNAHFEVVDAAWMSADELRLYVSGILRDDDSNGYDLYELSRPVPEAAFGVPENLTSSVNTPFVERMPRLSGDETLLVFESDRTGNGNLDLFVASRAVSNLPFDLATPMDTFNTLGREDPGWLNADGSFLYFNSGDDLYVASPVAEAAAIDELNTAVIERYPIVTADGLFLYFARDNGPTNTDIHVAKRNSTSEDFGPATPLSILNSAERDFVSWVSADHCTLILGSDRTAGGKLYELFIARRAPLSP